MGSLVGGYVETVQTRFRAAFAETYTAHRNGVSLAVGLFLIALPNLGVSLLVVAALGKRFDWANPQVLSAAALVLNPLVKGVVYALSFSLGTVLLGPVPGVFEGDVGLLTGPDVLARLLVGNVVIAGALGVLGYGVGRYGTRAVRASTLP